MSDIPAYLKAARCPTLQAAHRYSQNQLRNLVALFQANAMRLPNIETVALGGSLGRFEASLESDIDCIIVLRDDTASPVGDAQIALVHQLLASSPFKPPKPDGIYRRGVVRCNLLSSASLGSLSEAPEIFGKRIQLMLDARPIFGYSDFQTLQRDIVDWYGSDFLANRPSRAWTYLCNDLTRYLHSYAGWQQFKFERSADDSWQLRQAKFRTSRLMTFAAMMYLLGESDRRLDKLAWLKVRLTYTPLERLYEIMLSYDAAAYRELLVAYEASIAALARAEVRAALIATGPDAETRMSAELDPVYQEVRQSSAALPRILTEFALARRAEWGARFFERWLF